MQRRAALARKAKTDIFGVCASHDLSQSFQSGPGKLYCRLIKILELGGLAIKKDIASGLKPIAWKRMHAE